MVFSIKLLWGMKNQYAGLTCIAVVNLQLNIIIILCKLLHMQMILWLHIIMCILMQLNLKYCRFSPLNSRHTPATPSIPLYQIKKDINCCNRKDSLPVMLILQDGNPYTAWGRQIDKFMKYEEDYSGKKGREHTWQELSDRWRAAAPGITEEEFEILMKRGCKKLGEFK